MTNLTYTDVFYALLRMYDDGMLHVCASNTRLEEVDRLLESYFYPQKHLPKREDSMIVYHCKVLHSLLEWSDDH